MKELFEFRVPFSGFVFRGWSYLEWGKQNGTYGRIWHFGPFSLYENNAPSPFASRRSWERFRDSK
jgi:hypothetical protein